MRALIVVTLILTGCVRDVHHYDNVSGPSSAIVFLTDFGTRDGAVAAMKGVAREIAPNVGLFDLTHDIPPYDIWEGAYRLDQTIEYWPKGTVFVAVVDPGVGTDRRSVVLETKSGHILVGPDNGLFTLVADRLGVAALHQIAVEQHRRAGSEASHTFHGRDVFAVVAAKIASYPYGAVLNIGPALEPAVTRLDYQPPRATADAVIGTIPVLDPAYGNVWTNVDRKTFESLAVKHGDPIAVSIEHDGQVTWSGEVPYAPTFGAVPEGSPLLYLNSRDAVALAINMGNFAVTHKIASGPGWRIRLSKPAAR